MTLTVMDIFVKYAEFLAILWFGVLAVESSAMKKLKKKGRFILLNSRSLVMLSLFEYRDVTVKSFLMVNIRPLK